MTDKMPTREQIAEAIYTVRAGSNQNWHKAAFREDYMVQADAVIALFPQPSSSAEPGLRERVQALRDEMFTELDSPDHLVPLDSLVERMDALLADDVPPAEPVSITDMAPGTTFTAAFHLTGRRALFVKVGGNTAWPIIEVAAGALSTYSLDAVDQSTIRDVNPPSATPEEGNRG